MKTIFSVACMVALGALVFLGLIAATIGLMWLMDLVVRSGLTPINV